MEEKYVTAEDYRDAIEILTATNLSGVISLLQCVMERINKDHMGTRERNSHPIVKMYADVINHLSGNLGGENEFSKAYYVCKRKGNVL